MIYKYFMNETVLSYVTIRYDAPIIYLTFKEGSELGFPEIKELTFYAEKLSNKKNYVVFSDVREIVTVTPEGKKHALENKHAPFHKGAAVLVKNTAYSLAANLFIGLSQPEFPYKVFTDEQKAKEWLLTLPLENDNTSHSC